MEQLQAFLSKFKSTNQGPNESQDLFPSHSATKCVTKSDISMNISGRNSKMEGPSSSALKSQKVSDIDVAQFAQSQNKMEESKYFLSSKVVMLGESGVGKSSLVS
jgi:putative ribosome biogenesis GTPase RsgA